MAKFFANVRDLGAKADGGDDTNAFSLAFAACNSEGGGTVIVPTGTYWLNASLTHDVPVKIVGEYGGTKLRSFAADGWALKVTGRPPKSWGRSLIRDILFTGGDAGNGLSVQNASGLDLEYVGFTQLKIGLLDRLSHYGMRHCCRWFDNDVAYLLSARGGTVTNPNTVMPEADDEDIDLNNANKVMSACYINSNRIALAADCSKNPETYRLRFVNGGSIESNWVGLAALGGAANRQATLRVQDAWFEGNGDLTGVPGTETLFGETLLRGDVSVLSGQVVIENSPVRRAHVAEGASLTLREADTHAGSHDDYYTIDGSLTMERCFANLLTIGDVDRLGPNLPADLILPQKPTRASAFLRSGFHGAKAPHPKVVRADDCAGAAFATGFAANGITPSFQQAGGPFGQMITVASPGGGVGVGITLPALPAERFYVVLMNVKAAATAILDVNSCDWMRNGVTIDTSWRTVCWINYVESAADASALLQLGTATTYSIAGISVAVCQHAGEVEQLIRACSLPTLLA